MGWYGRRRAGAARLPLAQFVGKGCKPSQDVVTVGKGGLH